MKKFTLFVSLSVCLSLAAQEDTLLIQGRDIPEVNVVAAVFNAVVAALMASALDLSSVSSASIAASRLDLSVPATFVYVASVSTVCALFKAILYEISEMLASLSVCILEKPPSGFAVLFAIAMD